MSFHLTPFLENSLVRLRALTMADYDALFEVASESLLWLHHPIQNGYTKAGFDLFFKEAVTAGSLLILDRNTNTVIGCTRMYGYNEQESSVVIGHTFIGSAYWGKGYNQSIKQLMLDYAFTKVKRVLFYIVQDNLRSQRALQKIGAINVGNVVRTYGDKALHCFIYEMKQS